MDRARRDHHPFMILFLDVDHVKALNDRYGHSAGDSVLQRIITSREV